MALAIDITHGPDPSSKMHHQLQPKNTKVKLYHLLILQEKVSYVLYITSKTKHGPGCRNNAWAWPE